MRSHCPHGIQASEQENTWIYSSLSCQFKVYPWAYPPAGRTRRNGEPGANGHSTWTCGKRATLHTERNLSSGSNPESVLFLTRSRQSKWSFTRACILHLQHFLSFYFSHSSFPPVWWMKLSVWGIKIPAETGCSYKKKMISRIYSYCFGYEGCVWMCVCVCVIWSDRLHHQPL